MVARMRALITDVRSMSTLVSAPFLNYVIVGDVGGHASALEDIVRRYGCDPATGFVPEGTVVIQVGDLVRLSRRRGEFSDVCVTIADRFMKSSPGRWIQLFGNHEIGLLGGPRHVTWTNDVSLETLSTVRRWWDRREARFAVSLRDSDGRDVLISHAGLVFSTWDLMGCRSCPEFVAEIDSCVGRDDPADPSISPSVGYNSARFEMWPSCLAELYPSWQAVEHTPFDQVHGHSSPVDWRTGLMHSAYGSDLRVCEIDPVGRICRTRVGLTNFTAIDWVLSDQPYVGGAFEIRAFEIVPSEASEIP